MQEPFVLGDVVGAREEVMAMGLEVSEGREWPYEGREWPCEWTLPGSPSELRSVSLPITLSTTEWFVDYSLLSPGAEDCKKSRRPSLPTSTPLTSHHGDLGATSPGGTAQETQSVSNMHKSMRRVQDGVLREFASMFAIFVVTTLFATAPRWIALLSISWLVPHAPMPAALDDFKSMWAPCKDPKNMFPAYSPDGQLYTSLQLANSSIGDIGGVMMMTCFCHLWLAVQDWGKGTWARTMFLTALRLHNAIVIAFTGFGIASQVALHHMGVGAEDATTRDGRGGRFRPANLEQPDLASKFWAQVVIAVSFWVCVLASIARWWLLRESRKGPWFQGCQLHIAARRGAFSVIALFLCWNILEMSNPASFLYDMHIFWPLLMAKVGTGSLRMLLMHNFDNVSSVTIDITNFVIFATDFSLSLNVRVLGQGRGGHQRESIRPVRLGVLGGGQHMHFDSRSSGLHHSELFPRAPLPQDEFQTY